MNILYITNLSTNIAAGLNWSVPATVNAQSKEDNVFWLNLTNVEMPHWKNVKAFHNMGEFGSTTSIDNLPAPFNRPDIVVFEGFYHLKDPKLAKELRKEGIPYIITPRGSLTKQAQKLGGIGKRIKKLIANILIFRQYTKYALAIQYLTSAEQQDSGNGWNGCSFIVPNGFNRPLKSKSKFSDEGIKAVFIGRLDLYHKGLDILLEAIKNNVIFFKEYKFTLDIYGPQRYDYNKIDDYISEHQLKNIVMLHNEITGAEKEQILLDSDLFVLTSRFEGHPMGLVEAIAYGLPSLVTPGSNMADEIQTNDCGWVCKKSAEAIGDTLKNILQNKDQLLIKSKNALRVSESYHWERIAKDFHENVTNIFKSSYHNIH